MVRAPHSVASSSASNVWIAVSKAALFCVSARWADSISWPNSTAIGFGSAATAVVIWVPLEAKSVSNDDIIKTAADIALTCMNEVYG